MGLGSQLSNNISYSAGITGSEMMTGSPNTNTLSKRSAPGQQHSLRSFSTPAGSLKSLNQPKHIAVRPQLITSPLKKSPLNGTPGKGLPHIVTPTSRFMKDDDAMSTYSTEELNQEMANLEGIMKDLNAITASEFEMNN
ncbi:hypothetical protein HDE_13701 [Halotydeus destructor]|nr:hypothetical protein HDE_13701 [Halotydeus destructor]